MEPISLILTALAPGAAAAAKDTASHVVKDAYAGLKTLVQKRFADKPKAKMALAEYEADPETWQKPLQKSLAEAGVDQDQEVLKQAQQVMKRIQPYRRPRTSTTSKLARARALSPATTPR